MPEAADGNNWKKCCLPRRCIPAQGTVDLYSSEREKVSGIESCIQQSKKPRQKTKNLSNFSHFILPENLVNFK